MNDLRSIHYMKSKGKRKKKKLAWRFKDWNNFCDLVLI